MKNKLWAVKMFLLWRKRLGYWDFNALKDAWNLSNYNQPNPIKRAR